jgi:hypothetical protein
VLVPFPENKFWELHGRMGISQKDGISQVDYLMLSLLLGSKGVVCLPRQSTLHLQNLYQPTASHSSDTHPLSRGGCVSLERTDLYKGKSPTWQGSRGVIQPSCFLWHSLCQGKEVCNDGEG